MGIAKERITILNDNPVQQGKWVLYWMQQSQRAHDNPALEYAIHRANRLDLPVLVVFALTDSYPEANLRHYRFMLEGLAETQALLARRRIGMLVQKGDPVTVLAQWMGQSALLVCDVGYTRHQRAWRRAVSQSASCRTVAVEGDVVVPVAVVSPKAEYAARTIRPKISRHLEQFLVPCPRYRPKRASVDIKMEGLDLGSIDAVLAMTWTSTGRFRLFHRFSKADRQKPKNACDDSSPTACSIMKKTATSPRPTISPT
jgi:deoxyribodipyrimidine photo-lyase